MVPSSSYRALPGRGRSLWGSSRLYLADDHLLLVHTSTGRETYRRVAYRDVQLLLLRRTARGPVLSVVLGSLLLLCALLVLTSDGATRILWAVPATLLLVILGIHLAQGPTCMAQVRTPVQWLRLRPLSRWRTAERVLQRLRPEIEAVQGRLSAWEVREGYERIAAVAGPPLRPSPAAGSGVTRPRDAGHYHAALAFALFADAIVSFVQLQLGDQVLADVAGTLVYLTWCALSLVVVIRQGRRKVSEALSAWGWVVFSYAVVLTLTTFGLGFLQAVANLGGDEGVVSGLETVVTGGEIGLSGFLFLAWLVAALGVRGRGP